MCELQQSLVTPSQLSELVKSTHSCCLAAALPVSHRMSVALHYNGKLGKVIFVNRVFPRRVYTLQNQHTDSSLQKAFPVLHCVLLHCGRAYRLPNLSRPPCCILHHPVSLVQPLPFVYMSSSLVGGILLSLNIISTVILKFKSWDWFLFIL